MASSTSSFDDLLSSRLLDVPDYQRGYAWERVHLDEFWEDLDVLQPGGRHYAGTVVLRDRRQAIQDQAREVPLDYFDVVDGQQRLTTCTLLLDRIFDRLEALADDEIPSARRRLLTALIDGVKRPKVQLGPDISQYWHQVILDGKPMVQGARLAAEFRLSRASEYFEARLDERKSRLTDAAAYRTWLRRLAGKITGSLQFTLYVVGDDSEVGVLFETLNQRGKDLSELEKTKNYLLYLASLLTGAQRAELTRTINASWKTVFTNLGAAQLGPVHEDQLLRAHWLATENPRPAEWLKAKSIKQRFDRRRYVDDKTLLFDEITAYARSLQEASLAYRDIVIEDQQSFVAYGAEAAVVRKAARRLRQASVVALFAPLLIAGRLRFSTDGQAYASIVDLCERYSVRVFLINERRGNAGATRLYSLAHRLHHGADLAVTLNGVAERIRFFASDEATHTQLLDTHRNWYAKVGHKFFLYQYELSLLSGAAPVLSFEHFTRGEYKASTTEHVLPQNPIDPCWQVFNSKDCELYTHSLGNLTLTNDNSAYSNHCFSRKSQGVTDANGNRSACYATSSLKQEQELATLSEWTPQQVIERQQRLAQWAMERWKVDSSDPAAAEPTPDLEEEFLADAAADADPMLADIAEADGAAPSATDKTGRPETTYPPDDTGTAASDAAT